MVVWESARAALWLPLFGGIQGTANWEKTLEQT